VNGASLERRAPRDAPALWSHGVALEEGSELGGRVVGRDDSQKLPIEAEDERLLRLAQSDRILGQRLEDWLEIERRAADHLEQLAGRRLLLEGDPQFTVPRFQLLEQMDVLYRDDGLVCESLQKLDLSLREDSNLGPRDEDRPYRTPLPEHRNCEPTVPASGHCELSQLGAVLRIVQDIGNMNDRPGQDGSTEQVLAAWSHRIDASYRRERFSCVVMKGGGMHQLTVERGDDAEFSIAEPYRAGHNCVEHRLDLGRRARDHPQNLGGRCLLLERFGERGVLGLKLGEQPRVLDGDGRLIGEGLYQSDLTVRERQHLVPVDEDHAQQLGSPEHRNRKHRPDRISVHIHPIGVIGILLRIVNVNGAALQGRAR
jgi:hypothetical protein